MVEDVQPARVEVLCVLDILSCTLWDMRTDFELYIDVLGCVGSYNPIFVDRCESVWPVPGCRFPGMFEIFSSSRAALLPAIDEYTSAFGMFAVSMSSKSSRLSVIIDEDATLRKSTYLSLIPVTSDWMFRTCVSIFLGSSL